MEQISFLLSVKYIFLLSAVQIKQYVSCNGDIDHGPF